MRQILYNNTGQTIRLEFPPEWDPSVITDVEISIDDRDGTELLAATSITLMTATTLNVAADRYADAIELNTGSDTVYPGDKLLIDGAEGTEVVTVRGVNGLDVEIEGILKHAHSESDNVYGLFGTYTLDTSTVATFTAGLLMAIYWVPDGYFATISEEAQIATSRTDIAGLERSFSLLYPRAYAVFTEPTNRFADMTKEAERQVRTELMARNLDYNRIVDQGAVIDTLMAKMAWLWVMQGDEQHEDERKAMGEEYVKHFEFLCSQPIWADDDQDGIEDDNETIAHKHIFYSGW